MMKGEKPDRVPWFGDLSYWALSMEEKHFVDRGYHVFEDFYKFHEDLGVGFYLQGYEPFTPVYDEKITIENEEEDNVRTRRVITPVGEIEEQWTWIPRSYCEAPSKYFIESVEDMKVFQYWVEHTEYERNYEEAEKRYELVGDNGVVLCYLPKSPFMQLVALYAGIELIVDIWLSHQAEFEKFLEILEEKADQAAEIALNSPAECLMIPENLSSEVVGKKFFHDYMEAYQTKWVEKIAEKDKFSFVHMDGTLKGLISEIGSVGFTVMEALTPQPVGDLELREIRQRVPDESIVWGGIPGSYFTPLVRQAEFERFVKEVIQIMRQQPRYVLGVADQVPPDGLEDRVRRVGQLVEEYGYY